MHHPARQPTTVDDERHVAAAPPRLATVTVLANMRHRHGVRTRQPRPTARHPRNALSAWLLRLLAAAMEPGCRVRTTMASVSDWAELMSVANDADHSHGGRGPRIDVSSVEPSQLAAIEHACNILAALDAQPRLDVEVTCTPDNLVVTLRGILADPVMAPGTADAITEALHAGSAQTQCCLDATEAGSLRWELSGAYTAALS